MDPVTGRGTTKILEDISFNKGTYELHVITRGGTKSPELWLVSYNGRLLTPFEQRRLGITVTLNGLFKIMYSPDLLKELIFKDSPLLRLPSPKYESRLYSVSVVLVIEHGIKYKK